MSFKQYSIIMALATCLCWAAWIFVIVKIDPDYATTGSLVFFYVTLFASVFGTSSIITCALFYFFSEATQPMYKYVQKSFNLSFLVALFIIVILYMQAAEYLNPLTTALLSIGLCLGMLFLLKNNKNNQNFFPEF